MNSYISCVEELDTVAAEIHQQHEEPSHAIHAVGLDLDYGMTEGRLIYRPGDEVVEDEPALEFTLSNSFRGLHRYFLSREAKIVIVQPVLPPLKKSEVRKPKEEDRAQTHKELATITQATPFMIMTISGLRRLTSDMAMFKEKSLTTRKHRAKPARAKQFRAYDQEYNA